MTKVNKHSFFVKSIALNVCYFTASLVKESMNGIAESCVKMAADAKLLKDVTAKLLNLRLDHTEFTCLKALALFKPGTKDNFMIILSFEGKAVYIEIFQMLLVSGIAYK